MEAMTMDKWLNSGYILKVKAVGFPDALVVSYEEKGRVFIVTQHEITS